MPLLLLVLLYVPTILLYVPTAVYFLLYHSHHAPHAIVPLSRAESQLAVTRLMDCGPYRKKSREEEESLS